MVDVNKAFVERLILACGGDDDAGKTKARTLLGVGRPGFAVIRARGRLLVQHIDHMLALTKQSPSDWLAYLSRLAAKLEGLRAGLEDEADEPIMKGQKDARKALLSGSAFSQIDVAQLPEPALPRELLEGPKRGRPPKPSSSSR